MASVPETTGEAAAAIRTLGRLGYEWHGGVEWKPPLGAPPPRIMRPDIAAVLAGEAVAVPAEQWAACFQALAALRAAYALGDLRGDLPAETERLVALFSSKIAEPANAE
jgi:hypothetical protein